MGFVKKISISFLLLSGLVLIAGCQKKQVVTQPKETASETATAASRTENTQETTARQSKGKEVSDMPYQSGSLLKAVTIQNLEAVKNNLAMKDVAIDERDSEGNTPLLVATHQNDVDIAKALIDHGADVNTQNKLQDSAYLYAGAEGRYDILAYMLKNTKPNQKVYNRYGGNTLIPAAEKGHIDNVRLLLEDGHVDIDHQNTPGYTALIEAVALNDGSKRYQDISRLLLENGANKRLRDQSGRTAQDYAVEKGYTELIDILNQY